MFQFFFFFFFFFFLILQQNLQNLLQKKKKKIVEEIFELFVQLIVTKFSLTETNLEQTIQLNVLPYGVKTAQITAEKKKRLF